MQDAIIKGNGNSRYLKTVAAALSLYPTYEDFLRALVAGNFPIDLNGINEAGWTQLGTALSKNNLLPDPLATSLGLPTTATVADALSKLLANINTVEADGAKIETGSYVGTGTYGADAVVSIPVGFKVKLAFVFKENGNSRIDGEQILLWIEGAGAANTNGASNNAAPRFTVYPTSNSDTFSWHGASDSGSGREMLNSNGITYRYLFIG